MIPKRIDVLWLFEHTARELDVACAVKSRVRARYGVDITIRNIYLHANQVMNLYSPAIVIFPFLYRVDDAAIKDYVEAWPETIYFNFACEQIHYKAHLKMKAPGDDFTRCSVIHHAWGDFYKNYLVEAGVPHERIFVNGNPVYQLYKKPYKDYFKLKVELARHNGLDPEKRWVFIPENYKWAFFSDDKLQKSANRGGKMDEHLNMRAFCRESLHHLLHWCNETSREGDLELVFRPRPTTNSKQMAAFFNEHVGEPSENLHFTKEDSVREWIMASDLVISSISTSLIEAAVASKPIYMVEPMPIPDSLHCDWYGFVPRIRSKVEFINACLEETVDDHRGLQHWAEQEMLSRGDPIQGLADFIGRLVETTGGSESTLRVRSRFADRIPPLTLRKISIERRIKRLVKYSRLTLILLFSASTNLVRYILTLVKPGDKDADVNPADIFRFEFSRELSRAFELFPQGFKFRDYFNPITHEGDFIAEADINARVENWSRIIENV